MPHTKNFYMQIVPGVDTAFGFGDTEDTYEQRQKGYDYAKVSGYSFALGKDKWEIYGWWEDRTVVDRAHHQDKEVHKFIMTFPTMRKKDEVFVFDKSSGLSLDIIKDKINERFFNGGCSDKPELTPHKHQKDFLAKAQAEYLDFLLHAKCRSGKSIMTLLHTKERGYKVTLVVARMNSPKASWRDDSIKYSNFDDMVFIDLQGNVNYNREIEYWMNTDKQIILFDTVQGAVKKKFDNNVDFLVYDEAHNGYNSPQWNILTDNINAPILYVTGTAYKMADDFREENTFTYSYFEEQYDKKMGLVDRPMMNVLLANYDSVGYYDVYGDDPAAMRNLFSTDSEGKFTEPTLVKEFVSRYFSGDRKVKPKDRLLHDSNRLYITVPSVDACDALSEELKGTRFTPLVVHGSSKKTQTDIEKFLEENPTGAAIITRTANVLGVTADVDTVINCAEGASVEFWTQFAFRGGSGENDWRVIDFVPQRCVQSLREMYVLATENEPQVSEFELTDYVNISEWDDGFTSMSQDCISKMLATDPRNTVRLVSGLARALNITILNDMGFTPHMRASDDNIAKRVVLNDNNANGKSNKQMVGDGEENEKSETAENVLHVQAILERMPLAILHMIMADNTPSSLADILSSEQYVGDCGDDEGVLIDYLERDSSYGRKLAMRVNQAVMDIKTSASVDLEGTLDQLAAYGLIQQPIPDTLLEEMFHTHA